MFTGIEINGVRLPSSANQTYKLKQNSTLFDIGVPKGEYTMPISLEMDDVTMRALGLQHRINFKDKFEKTACKLFYRGVFVRNAVLVVEETSDKITGYLLTGTSTLAELMRTTYLDDVNYGSVINPGSTEAAMVAHMKDTVDNPSNHKHVFAQILSADFNSNFVNKEKYYTEVIVNRSYDGDFYPNDIQRVNEAAHVPFPYLKYVLEQIHLHFGYTLVWPLMDDATFEKLVVVNNRALLENETLNNLKLKSNTMTVMIPTNATDGAFVNAFMGPVQAGNLDENNYTPYGASQGLIPGTVLKFDNALIDIDTPAPYTNTDNQFDTANGRYLVRAAGTLNLNIDMNANLIESGGAGAYTFIGDEAQMYFLELSIDGVRIAHDLVYFDLSMPIADFYNNIAYSFTINGIELNESQIGKYIDIKIGAYGESIDEENNDTHFLYSNVFKFEIDDVTIDHSEMETFQKASYEIDYAKHLEHITCSEFLASMRNRFGAYVQHVNNEDKVITYAQLSDAVKGKFVNRFKLRDEFFTKKSVENSHKWKYNFDAGEEAYWDKFYNVTIGDPDADITHNEYDFDFGPVFYDYVNYRYLAIKNMSGIHKDNENTEVNNYLSIYHGLRDRGDGINDALVCSRNDIDDGGPVIASSWGLHWREADGLYAMFLEDFWKYFVEYMEIEFVVHPDVVEVLQFKYENVDFYHHMKLLVKEIDFEISKDERNDTKAVMVKLDL